MKEFVKIGTWKARRGAIAAVNIGPRDGAVTIEGSGFKTISVLPEYSEYAAARALYHEIDADEPAVAVAKPAPTVDEVAAVHAQIEALGHGSPQTVWSELNESWTAWIPTLHSSPYGRGPTEAKALRDLGAKLRPAKVADPRSGRQPKPGEVKVGDLLRITSLPPSGHKIVNPDDPEKSLGIGDVFTVKFIDADGDPFVAAPGSDMARRNGMSLYVRFDRVVFA